MPVFTPKGWDRIARGNAPGRLRITAIRHHSAYTGSDMADATGKTVRVVVVTPEKAAFEGDAEFVVLPMYDGELGVLPGRAPLIGRLGAGELRLTTGAAATRFYVEPGFAQVRADVVTVLTAKAVPAANVTAASAEQAATAAAALPSGSAVERANKDRARERAAGMKQVAAKNAAAV